MIQAEVFVKVLDEENVVTVCDLLDLNFTSFSFILPSFFVQVLKLLPEEIIPVVRGEVAPRFRLELTCLHPVS